METNLYKTIFQQFLQILEKQLERRCCGFDECKFIYFVREKKNFKLLDIFYENEESCGRQIKISTTIDITNICFNYLSSQQWIKYLKNIAKYFASNICPSKIIIPLCEMDTCRTEPKRCKLIPCNNITIINDCIEPKCEYVKCNTIIQKQCICNYECCDDKNKRKELIIIKSRKCC